MGVEIVHHETHLDRGGVAFVEHGLDKLGPVLAGAALGHLDVAATGQRLNLDKERGHPVAHIFVVEDLAVTGGDRNRRPYLTDELLARFVHANHREARVVRQAINLQYILHRGDERRVAVGRDLPVFA